MSTIQGYVHTPTHETYFPSINFLVSPHRVNIPITKFECSSFQIQTLWKLRYDYQSEIGEHKKPDESQFYTRVKNAKIELLEVKEFSREAALNLLENHQKYLSTNPNSEVFWCQKNGSEIREKSCLQTPYLMEKLGITPVSNDWPVKSIFKEG